MSDQAPNFPTPAGWTTAPVSQADPVAPQPNAQLIDLRLILDPQGALDQFKEVNEQLAIHDLRLIEYEEALADATTYVKDYEAKIADYVADLAASAAKEDKTLSSEQKRRAEVKRRLAADPEFQKWDHYLTQTKRAFARLQVARTRLGREWQGAYFILQRGLVGKNPEKP